MDNADSTSARGDRAKDAQGSQATDAEADCIADQGLVVVGIGTSAGGLDALKQFFSQMSASPGVAFVIVMHLSPEHESHLAELLQPHSKLPVTQITETTLIESDRVYVIPPNANLDAIDTHLRLSELEANRRERAPINHFFYTLAAMHDGRAIGVILSGTGSDGTLGLRRIKDNGGVVIVQSPEDAQYDGMPRSAIETGMVDLVMPVEEMPAEIVRLADLAPISLVAGDPDAEDVDEDRILIKILTQVRARTGHDFTQYKRSTITRRIKRRMQLRHLEKIEAYLDLIRDDREESIALFDDLLITVTEFFRDPEVFDRLQKDVLPGLFEKNRAHKRLRVWSVGCSTGEEAYSIAMILLEEAGRHEDPPQLQVFASDLHSNALSRAREGVYPAEIASNVSSERLARFFIKENGHYRVRREVRELVVFAPHNLLRDPPFSHLDMIVCRNLLIYLQRDIQQDVMSLFHYALEPEGMLVLGPS